MRIYRPGELIPPLQVDLQTRGSPGAAGPWFTGTFLIAAGVLVWAIPEDRSGLTLSSGLTLVGFSLALVFAGLSNYAQRIPALARFGTRHRFAIILAGITILVLTFGPVALNALVPGSRAIGFLFLLAFAVNFAAIPLWLLQRRNARGIAARMHARLQQTPPPVAPALVPTPQPATPGELVLEFYEVDDLPLLDSLLEQITADSNIVGLSPCHILHLYNFFADEISEKPRPLTGWRLHGPVAMLGSPLELARRGGYSVELPQLLESQLLNDPTKLEARLAAMSDVPLPPETLSRLGRWKLWWLRKLRRKTGLSLPPEFADSGAYAEELLLCTDETWKAAVEGLTRHADKVVMDAADFSAQRHGLIWEIQHLVDHFAAADFVVVVNSFTDLPALGQELRRAWSNMAATSPNNRPEEARVRLVLLKGDDKGGLDDDSALGGRSIELRDLERIGAHHRIMALLRAAR